MKQEKEFWLVTTGHLEDRLWFRDEEDFKVGMNYVAVQAALTDVSILAFILMSNHVHFVLHGVYEDALAFINRYKKRYAKYFYSKYKINKLLKRNSVDIRRLPSEDEAVERAIAYVHMNCVAANICANSSQYPWGSGNVLFNLTKPEGKTLKEFSFRERKRILHCTLDLPLKWIIGGDGYIVPDSFLARKRAEAIFRTPKRMNYFLASSSKARKKIDSGDDSIPSFKDQIVAAAIPDICMALYGRTSMTGLSTEETVEVLRQIRFRFSSNINQIARVAGLSYADAAQLLD